MLPYYIVGGAALLTAITIVVLLKWGEKRGEERANTKATKKSLDHSRKVIKSYEDIDVEYQRISRELGIDGDPCMREEDCQN